MLRSSQYIDSNHDYQKYHDDYKVELKKKCLAFFGYFKLPLKGAESMSTSSMNFKYLPLHQSDALKKNRMRNLQNSLNFESRTVPGC